MTAEAAPPAVVTAERAGALLDALTQLVARAGVAVLAVTGEAMTVAGKSDGSPVSSADLAADAILVDGVARLLPGVPLVSEERPKALPLPCRDSFVLIDPLDGTREFIAGRDEFTVNLAIVTRGAPLIGIIAAPALGVVWRGVAGYGAERLRLARDGTVGERTPIHTRKCPAQGEPWIAMASRSHPDAATDAFIAHRPGAVRHISGSAVKFGRIAEGAADIYPRLAPTREWDVAAGHAVVIAAGGKVTDSEGRPLRFGEGNTDFLVPGFIAWGDPAAAELFMGGRR